MFTGSNVVEKKGSSRFSGCCVTELRVSLSSEVSPFSKVRTKFCSVIKEGRTPGWEAGRQAKLSPVINSNEMRHEPHRSVA